MTAFAIAASLLLSAVEYGGKLERSIVAVIDGCKAHAAAEASRLGGPRRPIPGGIEFNPGRSAFETCVVDVMEIVKRDRVFDQPPFSALKEESDE